jgi:outer membrane receptor protein involved in Fe transport
MHMRIQIFLGSVAASCMATTLFSRTHAILDARNTNAASTLLNGYTNDLPISIAGVAQPVSEVPSWTTFDLNVGYMLLDRMRLSLSVRNMLDRDPPVVLSTAAGSVRELDSTGHTKSQSVWA